MDKKYRDKEKARNYKNNLGKGISAGKSLLPLIVTYCLLQGCAGMNIRTGEDPTRYNLPKAMEDYTCKGRAKYNFYSNEKGTRVIIDPTGDGIDLNVNGLELITADQNLGKLTLPEGRTVKSLTDIFPCENPEGKERKVIGFYDLDDDKDILVQSTNNPFAYDVFIVDKAQMLDGGYGSSEGTGTDNEQDGDHEAEPEATGDASGWGGNQADTSESGGASHSDGGRR